jgi:hypothetical protein
LERLKYINILEDNMSNKHYVSFYFRPSTGETFQVEHTSTQFNSENCSEELEGILDDLKESYQDYKGFFKVSAVVEVQYSRDYWGEVDVDYYYFNEQMSGPSNWSELRYVWGRILCTEGLMNDNQRHYFFRNRSRMFQMDCTGGVDPSEVWGEKK